MNGWRQISMALGTAALIGMGAQALAAEGSVSAQSPISRQQAWQEAMSRLPNGAMVTNSRCNDVEIGYGNTRYYCVLTFTQPDPAEPEHKKTAAQD